MEILGQHLRTCTSLAKLTAYMEPKQDKHKSIYSKRKQAKTFSELKNHSKSGDYCTPSAETYRKIDELRTRYDYNKDKASTFTNTLTVVWANTTQAWNVFYFLPPKLSSSPTLYPHMDSLLP
ncbi:hypothetical protein HW555_004163 [Spodoptera exigua]|uniref:Uncharacterized protein n=1 Tax=Spodoptera exigua TaxID=7107 RepID=A0A835GMY8_SPOEX|nr:hypothetical protein HW555_004163 [Spodoptera exigua]